MTEGNKVALRFRSAEFAGLELGLDYFFGENDKMNITMALDLVLTFPLYC